MNRQMSIALNPLFVQWSQCSLAMVTIWISDTMIQLVSRRRFNPSTFKMALDEPGQKRRCLFVLLFPPKAQVESRLPSLGQTTGIEGAISSGGIGVDGATGLSNLGVRSIGIPMRRG